MILCTLAHVSYGQENDTHWHTQTSRDTHDMRHLKIKEATDCSYSAKMFQIGMAQGLILVRG